MGQSGLLSYAARPVSQMSQAPQMRITRTISPACFPRTEIPIVWNLPVPPRAPSLKGSWVTSWLSFSGARFEEHAHSSSWVLEKKHMNCDSSIILSQVFEFAPSSKMAKGWAGKGVGRESSHRSWLGAVWPCSGKASTGERLSKYMHPSLLFHCQEPLNHCATTVFCLPPSCITGH